MAYKRAMHDAAFARSTTNNGRLSARIVQKLEALSRSRNETHVLIVKQMKFAIAVHK